MSMFNFESPEVLVLQDDTPPSDTSTSTEVLPHTHSAVSEQPREFDPITGAVLTLAAGVTVIYLALKAPKKEDRYIQ